MKLKGILRRCWRKVFKKDMEAWKDGLWFFQEFADIYGDGINDIDAAEKFFADFMKETGGSVIVDFLDTDNWDCIRKIEVDKQNGLIWFYWQVLYDDPIENQMRKMAFPCDYYGLCLKFDNVRFVRDKKRRCFGICVNGYTIREKKIKGYSKSEGWDIKGINSDESFFSTSVLREKRGIYQHWRFINTPICSFWIIPKRVGINPQDSEKMLYLIGVDNCETRLKDSFDRIKEIENFSKEKQKLIIKSVGNEMRNIAENLFKLIQCFYQEEFHFQVKNYDDLLLGDLTGPLKKSIYKSKFDETRFGDITRISNDLSHDSGNPVSYKELGLLYVALIYYIGDFKSRIVHKGNEIIEEDKSDKPGASDYIELNYEKICYADEINETIKETTGKLSYTIKVNIGKFHSFKFGQVDYYLCQDGYIRKLEDADLSKALKVWNREELVILLEKMYKNTKTLCQEKGYDTEHSSLGLSFDSVLHREGNPTHLFTEQEIKQLMLNANDDVNNKLVIDEDGYARIIQDPQQGKLYPVSQETWCAGNRYVGKNSKLTDLHDSYVLSMHSWLGYLQYGCRIFDDVYKSDHNLKEVIKKVKEYYS